MGTKNYSIHIISKFRGGYGGDDSYQATAWLCKDMYKNNVWQERINVKKLHEASGTSSEEAEQKVRNELLEMVMLDFFVNKF